MMKTITEQLYDEKREGEQKLVPEHLIVRVWKMMSSATGAGWDTAQPNLRHQKNINLLKHKRGQRTLGIPFSFFS